jgi:Tat protein secretion system quality control protein TatD with DNase activity
LKAANLDYDLIYQLSILEKTLGKKHPIQLHFFTGGIQKVEAWQGWNVYFSVPVGMTHQQPAQGFKTILRGRLLLETDAPYMPLPGRKHSTPFDAIVVSDLSRRKPANLGYDLICLDGKQQTLAMI